MSDVDFAGLYRQVADERDRLAAALISRQHLVCGTEPRVGHLVVVVREVAEKWGLAHSADEVVHEITSLLGGDTHLVECGPSQFGVGMLRLAPDGSEVTCKMCEGWHARRERWRIEAEANRRIQLSRDGDPERLDAIIALWEQAAEDRERLKEDLAGMTLERDNLRTGLDSIADELDADPTNAPVVAHAAFVLKCQRDEAVREVPLWLQHAITKMHGLVDQTDPNDPVGIALTVAGLERNPEAYEDPCDALKALLSLSQTAAEISRCKVEEVTGERDALKAEVARLSLDEATMKLSRMIGLGDPVRPDIHAKAVRQRGEWKTRAKSAERLALERYQEIEELHAAMGEANQQTATPIQRLREQAEKAEADRSVLGVQLDGAHQQTKEAVHANATKPPLPSASPSPRGWKATTTSTRRSERHSCSPSAPTHTRRAEMLDTDADAIMHARYIADQVRLGKRTLSAKERSALAMGFDACDRQRAEAVREIQARRAADLSDAERMALTVLRERMKPALPWGNPQGHEMHMHNHAIEALDRLLSTRKP